ncbi:inositol-tetrakisphosphate 1-kinase-like [Dreissena polymorpha]|uniref:Inositol-tetrakisphosphate 1-kinase n=1 Tax=Dreissena polymorpha TaxID=45954 RepID=A0A9D4GKH8_DREPO|nr:inositol-tetrakisphosphate 1-kinase-like [Dreissena polymorpha]KAH3818517.1 hypothetical protein DPMN_120238 [Dreissena polymorpha]
MKRVGYWLSEEKSKKLNFERCLELYRKAGVQLVKLDLETPLEGQGPFHMILHKFIDILALSQLGYEREHRYMRNIEEFISRRPDCIIVNPLDRLQQFIDRKRLFRTVQECCNENTDTGVFLPPFADLTSNDVDGNRARLMEANVRYPFVCKPVNAHGTEDCHMMAIVFNEAGLCDVTAPCVAHQFINHDATLYKVFKIGRKQYVIRRPSLRNLFVEDGQTTVFFNTRDVSKKHSAHLLTKPEPSSSESAPLAPEAYKLDVFCEALRQKLGVDMFGVDVIVDRDTHRCAVIDVNFFPGYNEVETFFADLLEYLSSLFARQKQDLPTAEMP